MPAVIYENTAHFAFACEFVQEFDENTSAPFKRLWFSVAWDSVCSDSERLKKISVNTPALPKVFIRYKLNLIADNLKDWRHETPKTRFFEPCTNFRLIHNIP